MFVVHAREEHLHPHPETSHTEHGLHYLERGWIRLVHGAPIRVEEGALTIMPAGVPHTPLEGRDVSYWMLGFCPTCLNLDEGQLLMSPFRRVRLGAFPAPTVQKSRRRRVVRLFRELDEEIQRGAPESPELARSLLMLLLGEVRRAMPGQDAPAPAGSLVSEALAFIQRRCLEPISLEDVAAAVHRTPAHVTSSVKKATGFTVGQWITSGRIAEAAARLAHTDDSLDAIAEHVGWRDKTHFIRQFRKAHGVTPAAWRRQHRTLHPHDP